MRRITRVPFGAQILAGLAFGLLLGYIAREADVGWLADTLEEIGDLFVQLLFLAVPPLVFTAVVVSLANLSGLTNAARLAGRTLLWFMATSLIAVSIGLALGLLTDPGAGAPTSAPAVRVTATIERHGAPRIARNQLVAGPSGNRTSADRVVGSNT